jgi:hypothetical protein
LIIINSNTRHFSIPGSDLVFGVVADSDAERKHFQCPRYVGDNLDLAACFIRINYRNANGKDDFYLVDDLAIDGDNITFSWLLSPKVTEYRGQVKFVMCAVGPDLKLRWHTTQGTGQVMEGLEPDNSHVVSQTADVVAQLIAMVEEQTTAVENTGAEQIEAVKSATETARTAAVNEIEAKRANAVASIPKDYTTLSGAVESLARGRGGAIVCDAEGTAITVYDASDMPIQGLRVFGRSTQDGIPTPNAPVEIKSVENSVVTVCGENILNPNALLQKSQYHGIVAEHEGNGIFHFYGTVTSTQATSHFTTELAIPIDPSHNYTMCAEVISGSINGQTRLHPYFSVGNAPGSRLNWIAVKVDSSSAVGSVAYNTAKATDFMADGKFITRFWVYVALPTIGDTMDIRIRIWATRTDAPVAYTSYTGQTVETQQTLSGIPVTSGGNYTDVNGQQWICDEVDLDRGVYVQRIGRYIVEPEKLFTLSSYSTQNFNAFYHHVETLAVSFNAPAYVTHLPFTPGDAWGDHLHFSAGLNNSALYYFVPKTQFPDVETWMAFVADQYNRGTPITTMYILAKPIETLLSETEIAAYRNLHSNYPNTTVLNDAGAHMVVKYAADTKLYIDKKIKEALL